MLLILTLLWGALGVIPPTLLPISSSTAVVSGSAAIVATPPQSYFSSGSNNGQAFYLTPASNGQNGWGAFTSPVNATNGFTVTFDAMLVGGSSPPADGITCYLHGQATPIPSAASYSSVGNSIASVWDTYSSTGTNYWSWDFAVNAGWNPAFTSQVRSWTFSTPNYFITHMFTYAKAAGGAGALYIQPSGSSGFSLLGTRTGLGDMTAAGTWGTSTPRLGFAAATGGLNAAQYIFNVAYSAVQQCSPPSSVVLPAGVYASNDAAGPSYTYTCLPGYTVSSGSFSTLPCGSGATTLTSPPTCVAPTGALALMLNANTWTLGADAVWAAANSPNSAPGFRLSKNIAYSGGTALFNVPLYVAGGFYISYDIQFGPTSAPPADGVSFVLFEQAGASIPTWSCTARGGAQCYTAGVRFAYPMITYNGGATSAYIRVGVGARGAGLTSESDSNIAANTQPISTATFGSTYTINVNDKWSFTLAFYPGGTGGAANQVVYSISRGAASQTFSATVDINAAIGTSPALGGGFAWLGFAGATGGACEEAWVTNVQFMSRCPPSAYAATVMYNITESWTAGSAATYTARCQPGYCGVPTVLSCDPATATLTGSYPVCTPLGLLSGQQATPLRGEAVGSTSFNVTCAAGFTPDPAVTTTAWATGTCNLAVGSSTVAMPSAATFACIPSGAAAARLMQAVDPQWWLTADAAWGTTAQGTPAPLLNKVQSFSGGTAFYRVLPISVSPGFTVAFDISFTLSGTPADGVALVLHNDPRGVHAPTCPFSSAYQGSMVCANSFNNSMILYIPKDYNSGATTNYLSTGAFLFGGAAQTGGSAGFIVNAMPTLASGDVITANVTYVLATGLLSWTMTRTVGAYASQTFNQTVGDLRNVLGGSRAWLGFSAATGGSFAGHSVSNVIVYPYCANPNIVPTGAMYAQLNFTSTWQWTCVAGYYGMPVYSYCHWGTGALVSSGNATINCTQCPVGTYGAVAGLTTSACSGVCSCCSAGATAPMSCSQTQSSSRTQTSSSTASITQTSSVTATLTQSSTPSPSVTQSASSAMTSSATQSSTITQTSSISATQSSTLTTSSSQTQSPSQTQTPSPTLTSSMTSSASCTQSLSQATSPSVTNTVSTTQSGSQTRTASATQSASVTLTASTTQSVSQIQTPSVSQSQTNSLTISPSATASASQTQTSSVAFTPSVTQSVSQTTTGTQVLTGTSTMSGSVTRTPSQTASRTASQLQTGSSTLSITASGTPSLSSTPTQTTSYVLTVTPTPSQTASQTRSETCSPSQSTSAAPTQSQTLSQLSSLTSSGTASAGATATQTSSGTTTRSLTQSSSQTVTASILSTPSQSLTPSPTQLPSSSQSPTGTLSTTLSVTQSPTASPTCPSTGTQSSSSTTSVSSSSAMTPSQSVSFVLTNTPTPSLSSTQSSSQANSPSQMPTLSPSQPRTLSQSITRSSVATASLTQSSTTTQLQTVTPTDLTPSQTQSQSQAMISVSATNSQRVSPTSSQAPSLTPTQVVTPSQALSAGASVSQFASPTPTASASPTQVTSTSPTGTSTSSLSALASSSQDATATASGSPSLVGSLPASISATASSFATPSLTPSSSGSFFQATSSSQTFSIGASASQVLSFTSTQASTDSATSTEMVVVTRTVSQSQAPSLMASASEPPVASQSQSVSSSLSQSPPSLQQVPSTTQSPSQVLNVSPSASSSDTRTQRITQPASAFATASESGRASIAATSSPTSNETRLPFASQSTVSLASSIMSSQSRSALLSTTPCNSILSVPVYFSITGGIPPTAITTPEVGLLLRLSLACYLNISLGKVLIASVATSSSVLLVGPLDAVNTQPGACFALSSSRRRVHALDPMGASPDEGRRGRRLESPLTNVSLAVEVVAACVGETAALFSKDAELFSALGHTTANATTGGASASTGLSLGAFLVAAANAANVPTAGVSATAYVGAPESRHATTTAITSGGGDAAFPIAMVAAIAGAALLVLVLCLLLAVWILRRRKVQRDQARTDLRIHSGGGTARGSGIKLGVNPMHGHNSDRSLAKSADSPFDSSRHPVRRATSFRADAGLPGASRRISSIKTTFPQRHSSLSDGSGDIRDSREVSGVMHCNPIHAGEGTIVATPPSVGADAMYDNPIRTSHVSRAAPVSPSHTVRVLPRQGTAALSSPRSRPVARTSDVAVNGTTTSILMTSNPMIGNSRAIPGDSPLIQTPEASSGTSLTSGSQLQQSAATYGNQRAIGSHSRSRSGRALR